MVTQVCKPNTWESELGDSQETRLTKNEKKKPQRFKTFLQMTMQYIKK